MRILIISDTHGRHARLGRLEAELLVHCGDGSGFDEASVDTLDAWFAEQRVGRAIYVPGNHDLALQRRLAAGGRGLRHAELLIDRTLEIGGLTLHGAPWTAGLPGMAFHLPDAARARRWARIPRAVDLLITHSPPAGILDRGSGGGRFGCEALTRALRGRDVAVHAFGHVHASRGELRRGGTRYINAASLQRGRPGLQPPIVLDL